MHRFLSGAVLLAACVLTAAAAAAHLQRLWSELLRRSSRVAAGSARTYVASGGSISVYDTRTGEHLWRALTGGRVSRVTAHGQRVYTLAENGLLRAFDRAGGTLWQHTVSADGWRLELKMVGADLLLAGSPGEHLTAFDPAAGTELWRTDNLMNGTVFSLMDSVLVAHGTESGAITIPVTRALDAGSGVELWVQRGWSPLEIGPERTVLWRTPAYNRATRTDIEVMTVDT